MLEPMLPTRFEPSLRPEPTDMGQYVLIHSLPDGSSTLPLGVEVKDTYTRVPQGKGTISVVVQNMTPNPMFVPKGATLARLTEAQIMPRPNITNEVLKKLEEIDDHEGTKPLTLSRPERVQKLLDELDLQDWTSEMQRNASRLSNCLKNIKTSLHLSPER